MKTICGLLFCLILVLSAAGPLAAQAEDAHEGDLAPQDTIRETLEDVVTNACQAGREFTALAEQLGLGRLPALEKVMERMQKEAGQPAGHPDEAAALTNRAEQIGELLNELKDEFAGYRDFQAEIREEYGQFPAAVRSRVDEVYRRISEAGVDTILAWNGGRRIDALKAGGRVRILVSEASYLQDEAELTIEFEHLKALAAEQAADPRMAQLLVAMEQAFNRYMQTHARAREAEAMLIEIEIQQEILDLKVEEIDQTVDALEEQGDDAADQLEEAIEQLEEMLDLAGDDDDDDEGSNEDF